ncbi:1-phosphofructokinase [Bacillus mesophilus]|uniref:1-phosphofructokinase n=1 Tax=Bacillus mesophilus TaxID=1808955 RepID=A0A6M0Q7A2_9BACI|nr:1-phosphofructokinase [Bacillus mesophilus]MBM7661492.1 1-phosphofructokinase [Bacillus mesophilus]NEY72163.1 1-phosphofructokinase [Bacillus mesophilus]
MIYTCTLNPSIDYLVEVENLSLGSLNRTNKTFFYPGGKGINVSRVLRRLGVDNQALGFIGGFTGGFIKDFLEREGISHQFIEHDEPTRINIKLKEAQETEINGSGSFINGSQKEELYKLVEGLTSSDYFVLAGSYPPSISLDYYKSLASLCQEKGIPFIVDVSGPPLKEVLQYRPLVIKPNQHELSELVGKEISSKEEAITFGRQLLANGPQNIIISMGGEGAVLVNDEVTLVASVPKGTVKNSVGAGDSTVAGFLASLVQGGTIAEAFQHGVASGTATAFSTDLCTEEDVRNILSQVKIKTL